MRIAVCSSALGRAPRSFVSIGSILSVWLFLQMHARAQSSFDAFDPGANSSIVALATQPDGKIIAGGLFTTLGGGGTGTSTRNFIGGLNLDGTIDAAFDPGANAAVQSLAVQADGKILVGGSFTMLGGGGTGTVTRNRIARLNPD